MGPVSSSSQPATTVLARLPYLNCAPYFTGLAGEAGWEWADLVPHELGVKAASGEVAAGVLSLVDFLHLQDRFERLGPLGIAVRGRSASALLFSRKPLRQLEGLPIAVTDETSTTVLLLRLLLEQRYGLATRFTRRARPADDEAAEAALLIGDEALRFRATNRTRPYEIDVAFEWWLWQHLPFVFAVWAIRKDGDAELKRRLSTALQRALAANLREPQAMAQARAASVGMTAEEVTQYLGNFIYRLSEPEEQAIQRFSQLAHDHHLL